MKFGSLFTGIGGFDLALERAGMECAWQCEIDKDARKVLQRHFEGVKIYDDVRTITTDAEPVDLICGGFPCQDVSIAGKRAGLAGERSGLWHEFHRILSVIKPRWAVIENVPGLLSSNRGRDFAVILSGLADIGYCTAWRVLDSRYTGVAQRRRRVFLVASLGDGSCAEVLFESEGVCWDPPARGKAGEEVARDVAPSLTASNDPSRSPQSSEVIDQVASVFSAAYNRNSTSVIVEAGECIQTLTGRMGTGGNKTPLVQAYNISAFNSNSMLSDNPDSGIQEIDTTRTLDLNGGNPACNQGGAMIVAPTVASTLDGGSSKCHSGITAGQSDGNVIAVPLVGVRRIAPTECERLQGFPDGWTEGQSDSARYKQLGNAVTVNVVEWIGKRIMEVK